MKIYGNRTEKKKEKRWISDKAVYGWKTTFSSFTEYLMEEKVLFFLLQIIKIRKKFKLKYFLFFFNNNVFRGSSILKEAKEINLKALWNKSEKLQLRG